MPHVVDPSAVADAIAARRPVRILDVRWRLDSPEGRPAYVAGHLPGAVYVDLEYELSRRGHPELGRYPLPTIDELERAARRWGLANGDVVIVYDDNDAVAAARAWWLLRTHGVDVRVLDGGIRAWIARGLPLEQGDHVATAGTIRLDRADPGAASIDDAARAPLHGHLVDVRAPEHYRGSASGLDPAAGHIPGAVNVPTVAHIDADGRLRTRDEIRSTLVAAGVDPERPIVLYCATGIASAHSALALAYAGIDARVYSGSWSQWSRTPGRPVAVGRTPAEVLQGW